MQFWIYSIMVLGSLWNSLQFKSDYFLEALLINDSFLSISWRNSSSLSYFYFQKFDYFYFQLQCIFAKILVFTVCLWFFDRSFGDFYNLSWSSSPISVITEKTILRVLEINLKLTWFCKCRCLNQELCCRWSPLSITWC